MKMQILPADSADFPQLLEEISGTKLITIYAVDDKQYLQVNGFEKHQKIDKRAKSKYPAPPNPADSRPILPLDQGREGIKEGNADAAAAAHFDPKETPEFRYYRRAKEVLGPSGNGLAAKLLKSKSGIIGHAHSALELASTKTDPREYLGAIIRGREGAECRPDRSF